MIEIKDYKTDRYIHEFYTDEDDYLPRVGEEIIYQVQDSHPQFNKYYTVNKIVTIIGLSGIYRTIVYVTDITSP